MRAGRFFIYGVHDRGKVPRGIIPICIEAGIAFGTGHHETTALCLKALTALAREKKFRNVLDLGCGTGVLAIATAKLWKQPVIGSDIDHVAVAITVENAAANGEAARVHAILANGFDDAELRSPCAVRPDRRQHTVEAADQTGQAAGRGAGPARNRCAVGPDARRRRHDP